MQVGRWYDVFPPTDSESGPSHDKHLLTTATIFTKQKHSETKAEPGDMHNLQKSRREREGGRVPRRKQTDKAKGRGQGECQFMAMHKLLLPKVRHQHK